MVGCALAAHWWQHNRTHSSGTYDLLKQPSTVRRKHWWGEELHKDSLAAATFSGQGRPRRLLVLRNTCMAVSEQDDHRRAGHAVCVFKQSIYLCITFSCARGRQNSSGGIRGDLEASHSRDLKILRTTILIGAEIRRSTHFGSQCNNTTNYCFPAKNSSKLFSASRTPAAFANPTLIHPGNLA